MSKFGPKKTKLSVLPENWHTWYLGGVDSESGLRYSKYQHQNPFFGKFGLKRSKLPVLPENKYTWYLGVVDSESRLRFSKFRTQNPFLGKFVSKKSKLFVLPENLVAFQAVQSTRLKLYRNVVYLCLFREFSKLLGERLWWNHFLAK